MPVWADGQSVGSEDMRRHIKAYGSVEPELEPAKFQDRPAYFGLF